MSGDDLFVDSNILLYYLSGDKRVAGFFDEQILHTSFVVELELLSFPEITVQEQKDILGLLNDMYIHDIDDSIKAVTIELRKKYGLKLPDAIIAASAYQLNIPLLTSDKDFSRLENIGVIVYEP